MFYKNYVLVILFSIFLFFNHDKTFAVVHKKISNHNQIIEKIVATIQKGKINVVLIAKHAVISNDSIVNLNSSTIKFYKKGILIISVISEKMKINMETYDIKCFGKCIINISTPNKCSLLTSGLSYDNGKNLIYSNNNVKFTKNGKIVYGTSFLLDTKLNNIIIENQRIIID
ncbi:MAG: LPS export ABC transporter periplasmic protein LptC [Endomicrobium sp.]|jgi:LPS export ABC transporter protein LptC|nr:LPS export ABC transporter periplasmic protein LptC [Endomicrobium sp.]